MIHCRVLLYSLTLIFLHIIPVKGATVFSEISSSAGLSGDLYRSAGGHGLGVNWVDIDQDGWDDLFVVGGAADYPPKLFLNNKDRTFTDVSHLLPQLPAVEMSGSRFADFDRDGDKDIYIYTDNPDFRVLNVNQPDGPPNLLLVNNLAQTGTLGFIESADSAGVDDLAAVPFGAMPAYRSKTASWLDFDRDGCIDLLVGHLVDNAGGSEANQDRMYQNQCDGTFTDVTSISGLNDGTNPSINRATLASGAFHLNNDLWPDLYLVNVTGTDEPIFHHDLLYLNQGSNLGAGFVEQVSMSFGVGDDAQAGMGIDTADIDHDGNWDIYISDIFNTTLDQAPLGNVLYMGNGDGTFNDNSSISAGVQGKDSWGVNFFDVNNDTWEDLFVATIGTMNGDLLYINNGVDVQGTVTFTESSQSAGIETANARGSAVADFDHDGDLDFAVVNQNGGLQLFSNDSTKSGNWVVLQLDAQISNLDAIGAIITAQTDTLIQRRQVKGGSSAHSQDSLNVHFGLGDSTIIDELKVYWPSGEITILSQVAVNQYHRIFEVDAIFQNGF